MPPSTTSPGTAERQVLLDRVRRLHASYEQGLIPRLAQHEVNPGLPKDSRQNYLYFTLPVCINFQRSSPAMWASALATWGDPKTRYVFFPEQLVGMPPERVRADLVRHKLALQPNRHVHIWTTIARTLHDYYNDDPRQLIAEAEYDAAALIHLLQVTHRRRFPYLSGPKLSNYWPFILQRFTDVQLANAHQISIIPDTHVQQASVRLGVTAEGASARLVEERWRQLLQDSHLTSAQLHPVLWHWSRNRFHPAVD